MVFVVFILNFGFFSLKFLLSFFFEFINKVVERFEFFFFDWNGIKDLGWFWWVGLKLRNGFKGGCLDGSGFFKSLWSDSWYFDVIINMDKISSNLVFF